MYNMNVSDAEIAPYFDVRIWSAFSGYFDDKAGQGDVFLLRDFISYIDILSDFSFFFYTSISLRIYYHRYY